MYLHPLKNLLLILVVILGLGALSVVGEEVKPKSAEAASKGDEPKMVDPTKPYGFMKSVVKTETFDKSFELSSIFHGRGRPFAKVNEKKIYEGDRVGGALVVEIAPRYVVLKVAGVLQKLELKRESIGIVKR